MKIERQMYFCRERYFYDFGECSSLKGYAQCDTGQDASYHGIWANPFLLTIITWIEGEEIRKTCESEIEFINEMINLAAWAVSDTGKFGVDVGWHSDSHLGFKFDNMGLGYLRH